MEALEKIVARLPVTLIALLFAGWVAYDFYDFKNSPQSPLGVAKAQVAASQLQLENNKKKLADAEEFFKNLETLKAKIRQLTVQLQDTKAALNTEIDLANFVRMITLEAKKLSLNIKSIRPETEKKQEYYVEVPFSVGVKGAYVQILVFFDRIAKLQQVIRIADFEMKPSGSTNTKYVELEGKVSLVAYKYLGTAADEIAKKVGSATK